ncbi:hypothetical protein JOQ06_026352 [Pogonophryne albipinna]|uniref:Uncharacterized protein n=1 Tax=Pogonophryne albipinna TaxID=1090488 RepID=A0AAD6F749_9TELE|nr:hypothetical protein JOQ06_026352 [Pogonophryne albipinna]
MLSTGTSSACGASHGRTGADATSSGAATVSVKGLIDVCQPASEQLPEANFQSKLGHIPLGSPWQLHRVTPKLCFPLSPAFQNMHGLSSDQKLFLWETFSELQGRVAAVSGTPATFRERARRPIINQDPGVASSIHACGAEGTRGLLKRMTDHRVHVCVHGD